MLAAISVAVLLAQSPIQQSHAPHSAALKVAGTVRHVVTTMHSARNLAVDLHPMTDEEKTMYPGRERFDKTEWYESQFKSAKVVPVPEHVDAWHNGGLDLG